MPESTGTDAFPDDEVWTEDNNDECSCSFEPIYNQCLNIDNFGNLGKKSNKRLKDKLGVF